MRCWFTVESLLLVQNARSLQPTEKTSPCQDFENIDEGILAYSVMALEAPCEPES